MEGVQQHLLEAFNSVAVRSTHEKYGGTLISGFDKTHCKVTLLELRSELKLPLHLSALIKVSTGRECIFQESWVVDLGVGACGSVVIKALCYKRV
jgi:hypothetical protein